MFITITSLDECKYNSSEYAEIYLYFERCNLNSISLIATIQREFYIIEELIIKAFINIDMAKSKKNCY